MRWAEHNSAQQRRIVEAAISLYDEGRLSASLQDIGERAGVTRSVVYRQFADRRDLESAVRRHILDGLWQVLEPTMRIVPTQTPREVITRAAAAYVDWAEQHKRLHRLADMDTDEDGPLQTALDQIAESVADLLVLWFTNVGAHLTEADRAAADPLAHGLVGAVFAAVRRWVHLGCEVPDAGHLVDLIVESGWAMLDARARAFGVLVDPDRPISAQVTT